MYYCPRFLAPNRRIDLYSRIYLPDFTSPYVHWSSGQGNTFAPSDTLDSSQFIVGEKSISDSDKYRDGTVYVIIKLGDKAREPL